MITAVAPDGTVEDEISEKEVRRRVSGVAGNERDRCVLFLDDQSSDYIDYAALMAEAINSWVFLCRDGSAAGRLVHPFKRILLDMAASSRLDAGLEWLREYSPSFSEGARFVVFTQYEELREQLIELARFRGYSDFVAKSGSVEGTRNEILVSYGARLRVEGFIEAYDERRREYDLLVPAWNGSGLVAVAENDINRVLRRFGAKPGAVAVGAVIVGMANISARDELAVQFAPLQYDAFLPSVDSLITPERDER